MTDKPVITLQNGIDAPSMVADIIGADHVMGGVAEISAAVEKPGIVRVNSKFGGVIFGELDGRKSDRAMAFEKVCVDAGLDTELTTDIERALWKKFMLLVPVSGLTSVTRSTFGEIRQDPDTRRLIEDCIREVIAVARAMEVNIDANAFERTMAMVDGAPSNGRASMAIDLDLGRRLELAWLAGRVVGLGQELDVPTPAISFINTALKLRQDGRSR